MQVTVESCARETRRTKDGREYTGLKINGNWVNVIGDHRDKYKKQIDLEIQGNWGKLVEPKTTGPASGNGHSGAATIDDYKEIAMRAHGIAASLEPDIPNQDPGDQYVSRAVARAAIVNTFLIAFSNGKISLPEEDNPPPPFDDDIPF